MLKLVLNSVRFYWRSHLGVFFGIVLATAVLTGALLVGDSVDHSLRSFAMMRLGDIHSVANTRNHFFKDELALRLKGEIQSPVAAVLQLKGMAIQQGDSSEERVQVNQVEVLGIDADFWAFTDGFSAELDSNETALNEKLALALGVGVGDEVSLRVAKPSLMSRDAPLSWSGEERSKRRRYTVKYVVPDAYLGRFSLSPSQIAPFNAFVNLDWLQEQVELEDGANLLLVGETASDEALELALKTVWTPEHIGLSARAHASGVVQLESERVFFSPESARAALGIPHARPSLTYLVNSIRYRDESTPYSFAVAGPVPEGMADDEVVLNRWTANALKVRVGDSVNLYYAELQTNGDFVEQSRAFRVHSIREMDSLETELDLMPHFPGLSDVESCADWDVGMPMDDDQLEDEANEAYWDEFKETPKCFVTLKAGQDMWGNRFGDLTAIRYPGDEASIAPLMDTLQKGIDPARAGLVFIPARRHALTAVDKAMNFGGLFLGMSFFLIVAALLLTALLFAFGVEQRSGQLGMFLALGYTPKLVRRLFLSEGVGIALPGVLVGTILGALYTRGLIFGLSHYWQGAIAHAAIQYHAKPSTFVAGAVISFICALSSMYVALHRQSKRSARELIINDASQSDSGLNKGVISRRGLQLSLIGLVAALTIVIAGPIVGSADLMMPFFTAGAFLLCSGLGLFRHALLKLASNKQRTTLSLKSLAFQNIARRRGRSLTVVALLACGSFMVFAVAAMQENLVAKAHLRSSGTGGFSLMAESTLPIQEKLDLTKVGAGVDVARIKVRDGDDASCLNLNRAQTPRVLGVHAQDMIEREAFVDPELWSLLNADYGEGVIPALAGDMNTAMWNLMKKTHPVKGDILLFQDESGEEVKVKLVGALPMRLSVFQGTILMADTDFTRLYPSESGYRMFLIDTEHDVPTSDVALALGRSYDRFGLNAFPVVDRLMEFYAVEMTYLAMFLVLGGLGLIIGSVGMSVVVLRNLLERRGELAMLGALGFNQRAIYRMVLMEYSTLLLGGLLIGCLAAFIATIPALLSTASNIDMRIQLSLLTAVLIICWGCMHLALYFGLNNKFMDALRNE